MKLIDTRQLKKIKIKTRYLNLRRDNLNLAMENPSDCHLTFA